MRTTLRVAVLAAALTALACDQDTTDPNEGETFTATLTGAAERPNPVTTNATGTARVTFNEATSTFSYTLTVSNITGVTAAHIHGPATTEVAAGVLVPLTTPLTPSVSGTFAAAQVVGMTVDALLAEMRAGRTYVNVHTSANPAGAIRGQLVRE